MTEFKKLYDRGEKVMKNILFFILLIPLVVSAMAGVNVMAGKAEVVRELLPDAPAEPVVFKLTAENISFVQTAIGSSAAVRDSYEFYISTTGVIVIEEQMGEFGLIKLAVLLDTSGKTVKKIGLFAFDEKRDRRINRDNFLTQFAGKTASELAEFGGSVKAVSGATKSSKAVFMAGKRALAVYGAFVSQVEK